MTGVVDRDGLNVKITIDSPGECVVVVNLAKCHVIGFPLGKREGHKCFGVDGYLNCYCSLCGHDTPTTAILGKEIFFLSVSMQLC